MLGRLRRTLYVKLCQVIARWRANRLPGVVDIAQSARFIGFPAISCAYGARISIGDRSILYSNLNYTDLGVARPVIIRALSPGSSVSIGADCGLSGTTVCAALSVVIEDGCLIGADVAIFDTDFHSLDLAPRRYEKDPGLIRSAPIHIGSNVFIGARSMILKGVTIGRNAVVGAGSVVTRDIPENAVVAGNPAKVLRILKPAASPNYEGYR